MSECEHKEVEIVRIQFDFGDGELVKVPVPKRFIEYINSMKNQLQTKDAELGEKTQALTYANSCIGLLNEELQTKDAEIERLEKFEAICQDKGVMRMLTKVDNLTAQIELLTRCEWENSYPECDPDIETLCQGCKNSEAVKQFLLGNKKL